MMVQFHGDDDPFAMFTRAPANETPQERSAREASEAEAKKRSDAIDDELRREKARMKKEEKGVVKVLLLGQSESGKSTTLKNFRMKYARSEWESELSTWRTVIQLNLLKSVITVLDTLQAEQDNVPADDDDDRPYTAGETEYLYTPGPSTPSVPPMPAMPPTPASASTSVMGRWDPLSTPGLSPTVTPMMASGSGQSGQSATLGRNAGRSVSQQQHQQQQNAFRSLNINTGANMRRDVLASTSTSATNGYGPVSPVPSYHSPTISSAVPGSSSRSRASSLSKNGKTPRDPNAPQLTGKHQLLKLRLAPLRRVEHDLRRRLGASAEEEMVDAAIGGGGSNGAGGEGAVGGDVYGPLGNITNGMLRRKSTKEFSVRRLKDALDNSSMWSSGSQSQQSSPILPHSGGSVGGRGKSDHGHGGGQLWGERRRKDVMSSEGGHEGERSGGGGWAGQVREVDEATEVIASCAEDIKALWGDEVVRAVLKRRKIRLEDTAGFFLDDVDRIAQRTYTPSSDDVVRARLRTLGVQEYKIKFEAPPGNSFANSLINFGNEWLLYDVGGSRTGRNAWIPYFESVHAIIFLAPVSCFDERLLEDSRVNRLEDSFLLWRTVCHSRLLRRASLILFMNKCDLLRRKLKAGVKVKHYLPSFGERANDANTVVRYLKDKFRDIARSGNLVGEQGGRATYYYATSVTDTKTTAITLVAVKDIILREHLKNADFV